MRFTQIDYNKHCNVMFNVSVTLRPSDKHLVSKKCKSHLKLISADDANITTVSFNTTRPPNRLRSAVFAQHDHMTDRQTDAMDHQPTCIRYGRQTATCSTAAVPSTRDVVGRRVRRQ